MTHLKPEKDRESSGARELLALLQVLVRRRRMIVCSCLATALISAGYSLWLPNSYSATSRVLPPQKESSGLSSVLGQMGGVAALAGGAKGNENELYLSILRSRSVGLAVIEKLQLAKVYETESPNATLRKLDAAVKAQAGKDGIICITAQDEDPQRAARMANTLAEELGRALVRLNLSKVGSERLFLEKRLEVVKRDLLAAEEGLKAFAQKNQIVQVESQASASVGAVGRLKSEIAGKEVQLAVLRRSQTDDSFEVKSVQAALGRLKAELAKSAGNEGGGEGIPSIGKVPGLGLEYSRKLRELKTQETLFEQLTKQYEMAKLNEAKDSSSLQLLDEAVVPDLKSGPKRASIVVMATLAALVVSVLTAFLQHYLETMPAAERQTVNELVRQAFSLRFKTGGRSDA